MTRLRAVSVGLARRLLRLLMALAVVRLSAGMVGELVVAAVLGPAVVMWGVGRWVALERRLDNRAARASHAVVVPVSGGRVDQGEHVAFARALVAVSARCLAHCEDQADTHTPMEGWR